MSKSPTPTVDMRAPDGGRIVLKPVVQLDIIPGISRAGLAAVIVVSGIWLVTSFNRINHTDLWGHLSFGRWIAQHQELPAVDPFRPHVASEPVLNVYWLGQVLGYYCHEALGLEGLVLAHAALVTLAMIILMLSVLGRGVSLSWAVAAAVAAYLLALPITGTIRPQLFGMVGFAATLWAISRLPVRRHPLVWLPVVFAIWANMHGSFAMGLVVLGCFALGTSWETRRAAGSFKAILLDTPTRRAWIALTLALAACLLNPEGVELLAAVAGFSGNANLEGISEWRPMTLGSLSGALFFTSLFVTGILLRWSPRRIWAHEVLLMLVFGLAGLMAIRMLVWWALAWPWVVAPHAAACWVLYRRSEPSEATDEERRPAATPQRTLLAAAVIFATFWWSPPAFGLISGRARPAERVLSADTPQAVSDEFTRRQLTGRFFSPIDWADYLIWRNPDGLEPLVYSHVHLTSSELWHDFLGISRGSRQWLEVADHYRLDYLVLSRQRNRRLVELALQEPRCRVLYEDRQALLIEIDRPSS